ncbi:MAG: hypothetical protein ACRESC_01085, partial [Gammaproteobacteria bacterium]
SPDYFLQNLDLVNRRGLVVRIDRDTYRQAAFLDQRMFISDTQCAWVPLNTLLQATSGLPTRTTHYIFHIGHCGSTLLSRLLAELSGCLTLREPLAFLTLAMAQRELGLPDSRLDASRWQDLFEMVLRLQARGYSDSDIVLIKSTSVAGNLLQPVLVTQPDSRVILLYMDLETWLTTMLRASGPRESVRAFASAWLTDFRQLTGDVSIELHTLDDIRQAVIGWTTMLLGFTRAATRQPGRTHWLNFDEFLRKPASHCKLLTEFLALPANDAKIETLTTGPIMGRNAKDPRQDFDTNVHARELAAARQRFDPEIRTGMRWFEELTQRIPSLSELGPGQQVPE